MRGLPPDPFAPSTPKTTAQPSGLQQVSRAHSNPSPTSQLVTPGSFLSLSVPGVLLFRMR